MGARVGAEEEVEDTIAIYVLTSKIFFSSLKLSNLLFSQRVIHV